VRPTKQRAVGVLSLGVGKTRHPVLAQTLVVDMRRGIDDRAEHQGRSSQLVIAGQAHRSPKARAVLVAQALAHDRQHEAWIVFGCLALAVGNHVVLGLPASEAQQAATCRVPRERHAASRCRLLMRSVRFA